jgi:uncharacterized membrane protein YqaE (UPF0057 family)
MLQHERREYVTSLIMDLVRSLIMDLVRIVCAILVPPLGVFLQVGFGLDFWINIVLTLLGYIPGIIHAVWIIARR